MEAENITKHNQQKPSINSVSPTNTGYGNHAASGTKRSVVGWISSLSDPIDDIERNVETMRERSRDLYMGAPIASGSLKSIVTNVVGYELKLNAQIDGDFLYFHK